MILEAWFLREIVDKNLIIDMQFKLWIITLRLLR